MTNPKLQDFIDKHKWPGFYIDICGMYCLNLGKYLVSVFMNTDTSELEVCVDAISNRGMYEENLEWESHNTEEELARTICRLVEKYSKNSNII